MKGTLFFRVLTVATISIAFLFATQQASAAPITAPEITSTIPVPDGGSFPLGRNDKPIEVSVFEDQFSYTIPHVFVITNTNDFTVYDLSYAVGCSSGDVDPPDCATYVSGDPTDIVTGDTVARAPGDYACPASWTPGSETTSLGANAFCTVVVTLDLPDELDYGDFGISAVTLQAAYWEGPSSSPTQSSPGDLTFDVQVKDAPTPEPGSLLLLGTGMLGLAALVHRKLGRG
ncbi:MAG: PEP-CTERM sorting domain-containing protein [Terracidiphilus sp.]|jgi:hypothetical protein